MRNVSLLLRRQGVCGAIIDEYAGSCDETCALPLGHDGYHQPAGGSVPAVIANFNGDSVVDYVIEAIGGELEPDAGEVAFESAGFLRGVLAPSFGVDGLLASTGTLLVEQLEYHENITYIGILPTSDGNLGIVVGHIREAAFAGEGQFVGVPSLLTGAGKLGAKVA